MSENETKESTSQLTNARTQISHNLSSYKPSTVGTYSQSVTRTNLSTNGALPNLEISQTLADHFWVRRRSTWERITAALVPLLNFSRKFFQWITASPRIWSQTTRKVSLLPSPVIPIRTPKPAGYSPKPSQTPTTPLLLPEQID